MSDKLINVNLYGDGRNNSRLRAEYIYCEHSDSCSAYCRSMCGCVTNLFCPKCKLGRVVKVDGGLKRSKAYSTVFQDAKSNSCYGLLRYPVNDYVVRITDSAWLKLPYVTMSFENGGIKMNDPGFGGASSIVISCNYLTPENLNKICSFKPSSLMGSNISRYITEVIPMFLYQLSKLFSDQYDNFIKEYSDYDSLVPNFVGRKARASTLDLSRGITYKNQQFDLEGDYLVCHNWSSGFNPFSATSVEVRIPIKDLCVQITDNNQVIVDTQFLD